MQLHLISLKEWFSWPTIRSYLCTLAVCVSFNATWHVPRDGARFGGVQYALALTATLLLVALPLTLLQLAVGQLSQQDAVGVWRAVPFFKGVGYLRLLVSLIGAITTAIYLSLTVSYFLYTLVNSIPYPDCMDYVFNDEGYLVSLNSSECLSATFMAPPKERPEYYVATASIVLFAWIVLPFILYNQVKFMKRIFYVFGPLIIILGVVVVSGMAGGGRLTWFADRYNWRNFLYPDLWFRVVAQALLMSEVAGGYLMSAGDSIYSHNNVHWTAISFVVTNVVVSWVGLLFWFSLGGAVDMDGGSLAVLVQLYQVAQENNVASVWPLLAFAALFLSGVVTMLLRLYPIFDRIRRLGRSRWRLVCVGTAMVCAGVSLAVLAGRLTALHILEDTALPMLVCVATVLEAPAFVLIYGWRALMEDVEFLTGYKLKKLWVVGWCTAPAVVAGFCAWWLAYTLALPWEQWVDQPWSPAVVSSNAVLILVIFVAFAVSTVVKQVQYDIIGKLKSSFKPSRHWGPRDPITHYYWLARRDEVDRGNASVTRYRRRELGQLSGAPSSLNISFPASVSSSQISEKDVKRRANSDDCVYTVYRRKYLDAILPEYLITSKNYRSKSMDWIGIPKLRHKSDSLELKISNLDSSIYVMPTKLEKTGKEANKSVTIISADNVS